MNERITEHPILVPPRRRTVRFTFDGIELEAHEGEVISSALFAAGIRVFGTHHKDGFPQGIFCANGQCAQCLVLVDGKPMKACVTPVRDGLDVVKVSVWADAASAHTPAGHPGRSPTHFEGASTGQGPPTTDAGDHELAREPLRQRASPHAGALDVLV